MEYNEYEIRDTINSWENFKKEFNEIYDSYVTLTKALNPWSLMQLISDQKDFMVILRQIGLKAADYYDSQGKEQKASSLRAFAEGITSLGWKLRNVIACAKNEIYKEDDENYDYDFTWTCLIGSLEDIHDQIKNIDKLEEIASLVLKHIKE